MYAYPSQWKKLKSSINLYNKTIKHIMTTLIQTQKECTYCLKSFATEKDYENHELLCSYFYPSNERELLKCFRILVNKYTKLEKEVEELKRRQSTYSRPQPITEKLNKPENIPPYNFQQFCKNISASVTIKNFEELYMNDFLSVVMKCIEDYFEIDNEDTATNTMIPIISIANKPNMIYIYIQEKHNSTQQKETQQQHHQQSTEKWRKLNYDDLPTMFRYISNGLLNQLLKWKEEQILIMPIDEMTEKSLCYLSKVNGYNTINERQKRDFTKWLYKQLPKFSYE